MDRLRIAIANLRRWTRDEYVKQHRGDLYDEDLTLVLAAAERTLKEHR